MTTPRDIECPSCGALSGQFCRPLLWESLSGGGRVGAHYHHAERVDAALRTRTAEPEAAAASTAAKTGTRAETSNVYYGLVRVRVQRGRLVPLWYTVGDAASFDQMTVVDGEHTIAICTLPARSKEEARRHLKEELRWFAPLLGDAVPEPWFASEDPA